MHQYSSAQEVSDGLRLHKLHTHLWHVETTSAVSALGLEEGLMWLLGSIDDMRSGGA